MATLRTMLSTPASRRPVRGAGRITVAALAAAGVALTPVPASAAPAAPETSSDAAGLIAARAHDLEKLTEQFDTARDALQRQQASARAAQAAAGQASGRLTTARAQVRGVARGIYTSGGLSDLHLLLSSSSADDFVQGVGTLDMVARHQGEVLGRAATAAESAAESDGAARRLAGDAQATFDAVAAQERLLQAQIDAYQADLDRLSAQEKQAALERAAGRASRADRPAPLGPVTGGSHAAQVAVRTAMAQLGKPYAWGAAGPDSFDCSGLVQYAYQAAGVSLPHSAATQATMGRAVTRDELQPGDLIGFYSPVSHIGIYVGNGQMVHAPTAGEVVQVASIDSVGTITAMRRIAG